MDREAYKSEELRPEQYLADSIEPDVLLTPLSDDASSQIIEQLKREADRHWGIDPHRSLLYADRIVAIGEAREDAPQTALGLMARGDALKFLGRTTDAWDTLDRAGEMFRAAGDDVGWARTRIGRLYLSTMLDFVSEALDDGEQARRILLYNDEQEFLLRIELQTAYVHNYLGNQMEALKRFQSALAIAEQLGEKGEMYFGPLFTNIGSAYEALGDWRLAEDYYDRAREIFAERGDELYLITVESNIAFLIQAQGNYRRAIQMLENCLEKAAEHSDLESAKINWHLLECYQGLNRLIEARDLAQKIVAENRHLNDSFELARALLSLATIEAELASFDSAQEALNQAEAIFTSLGAYSWAGTVWLRRGRIALQQGNHRQAYQLALKASSVFLSAGQQVNYATARLLNGQSQLAMDNLHSGMEAGSTALRIAQQENLPSLRYAAHLLLGHLYEKQSALRRAERHYQAAAATTERVQRGLTITLQPGFLEDKAEASRALIGLQLSQGRIVNAFETLERAKSQVLLGYLANRERLRWAQEDPSSRELIDELDQLRAEHHLYTQLASQTGEITPHTPPLEKAQALAEVRSRERRMRSITEKLYMISAEGQALNQSAAPAAEDFQTWVEEDTLLIEFYNDGKDLYAFSLDRASVAVCCLPLTLDALNQLLGQLQANMSAALRLGAQAGSAESLSVLARRILQRLYSSLLEPLVQVRRGKRRLVIVPYGALHFLPFHLLYDGARYLFEQHEVVILPAAGLATRPSQKRSQGALIVANSWDGRLPLTLREAEMVQRLCGGKLYTEQAANRQVFDQAPAQILHIAAHGQHRLDQPDLSYIQLADGQLYTDDLLQQDMSYELVTLSACETGRARVAGGDELIGLGRGFLYAGAGALVLSLWPVPDETTLRLMEAMYEALLQGASKPAALNTARLKILAEAGELHPAYWGAFQLVGDASPLSTQVK